MSLSFWLKKNYLVLVLICFFSTNMFGSRDTININNGWKFKIGDYIGAENIEFNDSDWETVHVPHNWGWEEAELGNKEYYRGAGWYRKQLNINKKEGKRYFIRFEAVGSVADIYINGKHLGQHRGAFSAFTYEISKYLNTSGNNILSVRASNAKTEDVAPLSGDFNIYGGIYRSVNLIITNEVCFNLTDYASAGVVWKQSDISKEKAVLDVEAWISNSSNNGLKFTFFPKELEQVLPEGLYTVKAKIMNAEGEIISVNEKQINLVSNNTIPCTMQLEVIKPHLWHGTLDPYLYRAVVELYRDGVIIDKVTQPLGLRYFHIDPEKGFFLNGESYQLRGVAKHQDRKGKGWAVSKEDLEEDMKLIKEMGANAVRCAHYQHSDYWMNLCDYTGMLVWAEIGQVDGIGETEAYESTTRNQWLELIRQNINHPSVFAWGIFNEVRIEKQDPHRLFVDLKKIANSEDPTRPTVAATHHEMSPYLNQIPDILGWNRYPGWYDPFSDLKNDTLWDKYAVTSKNGGFAFSEYGAGANIEHHEQNPEQPITKGFWHPEEWQSKIHENAWESYSKKPYIWGSFVWNMFDFSSARRSEGGKKGINDKGLVTFDRQQKKDAYFFYKANWNQEPMIYITSKRHQTRNKPITPIKVYCNVDEVVTLKVNGKKMRTQKANDFNIAVWDEIKLKKGNNKVEVSVKNGQNELTDQVIWKYDPNFKSLKPLKQKGKQVGGDGF